MFYDKYGHHTRQQYEFELVKLVLKNAGREYTEKLTCAVLIVYLLQFRTS